MKLFIDHLKNKKAKRIFKNIGIILVYLGLGITAGIAASRFSLWWIIISIGALLILVTFFFSGAAYWIIIMLFLLLLGPIGILEIGGKTPYLFYEDFYLLGLVFLLVTVWLQKGKTRLIVSNYAPWALSFLGVGFLSLLITPDVLRGIGFLKVYLTGFLVLFLCLNVINKESDSRKVIYSLPLFGAILAGWLYYNISAAGTLTKAVVFVSWGHSNYLATFFVFLIPMTIGLLFYKKNTLSIKFYLLVSLILMMVGLISTESKGALIAFSIALLVFLFKVFRKNKFKVISLIILLVLIVILHPATKLIFHKMYGVLHRRSLGAREIIYQGAIKTFLTHPITGGGLGSLQHYMEQFTERASYKAHNEYLHTLAEMGPLGLIFFVSLFVISYKNICRLIEIASDDLCISYWAIGVLAGFIGVLVHLFVESCFSGLQFLIVFWIVMAVVYINLRKFSNRNKKW